MPRRCTHHSSFARHLRRSMCKRSSKSCSRRHSTSNASFPRLRGSASLYCSTWTCECPVRKPYSPRARTVRYAPTQSLPILWRGAIPCVGLHGSFRVVIPVVLFRRPRTHCIYPTPFVTAPALLSSFRSIVATAAYHAPSIRRFFSFYTLQPAPLSQQSIFQTVYLPRLFSSRYILGGPR